MKPDQYLRCENTEAWRQTEGPRRFEFAGKFPFLPSLLVGKAFRERRGGVPGVGGRDGSDLVSLYA